MVERLALPLGKHRDAEAGAAAVIYPFECGIGKATQNTDAEEPLPRGVSLRRRPVC